MNGEPLPAAADHLPRSAVVFAALLLRRIDLVAPEALGIDDREVLRGVASCVEAHTRAVAAGRALHGRTALHRALYTALRDRAAPADPLPGVASAAAPWRRALAALGALRHRQRAALIMRFVLGHEMTEVAAVLGIRESEAGHVVNAALGRASRAANGPVDLPRDLRAAGAVLDVLPSPSAPAPIARKPRDVVLRLVADPLRVQEPAQTPPPRRGIPWAAVFAALMTLLIGLVPIGAYRAAVRQSPQAPAQRAADPPATVVARSTVAAPLPQRVSVRTGESLWAIAGRELGDPRRWPAIWSLNRDAVMAAGERFNDPDLIRPGWSLQMPARA